MGGLLAKGRLSLEEGLALRQDVSRSVHKIVAEAQAGLESRLRALFGPAHEGPHASLLGLKERIDALSARVGRRPAQTGRGRAKAAARARTRTRRTH